MWTQSSCTLLNPRPGEKYRGNGPPSGGAPSQAPQPSSACCELTAPFAIPSDSTHAGNSDCSLGTPFSYQLGHRTMRSCMASADGCQENTEHGKPEHTHCCLEIYSGARSCDPNLGLKALPPLSPLFLPDSVPASTGLNFMGTQHQVGGSRGAANNWSCCQEQTQSSASWPPAPCKFSSQSAQLLHPLPLQCAGEGISQPVPS